MEPQLPRSGGVVVAGGRLFSGAGAACAAAAPAMVVVAAAAAAAAPAAEPLVRVSPAATGGRVAVPGSRLSTVKSEEMRASSSLSLKVGEKSKEGPNRTGFSEENDKKTKKKQKKRKEKKRKSKDRIWRTAR